MAALEKLAAAAEGAVDVQPGIQTEGPQAVDMHRTELLKQMQLAISMGGGTAQNKAATQKILQSIIEEVEGTLKHKPTDLGPRFDAAATRSSSPTMERSPAILSPTPPAQCNLAGSPSPEGGPAKRQRTPHAKQGEVPALATLITEQKQGNFTDKMDEP